MGFAAPLALALGLLAVPIVLLYLLKPRREQVRVPSTLLWRRVTEEMQANAPWQRLRRNLLLLLQLLALALLVLALARPLVRSAGAPGGDLVVVLDTSQSMAATDVQPSRFEAAKQRVRALVDELLPGRRVALIAMGPYPRVLVSPTTDRSRVARALSGLRAPYGEADLRDAGLLARALAGQMSDPTVALVTDQGPAETGSVSLPVPVRIEPVRGGGENAAILSVAARSGATGRELWVSLANYGHARTAQLTVSMDDRLYDAREVRLPANGTTGVALDDLPQGRIVEARLDARDAFPADDTAWYVAQPSPPARILLYGTESPFLERALSLLPGIAVDVQTGGRAARGGYDVYVFNGQVPDRLPDEGSLLLLGAPGTPLVPVRGELSDLRITSQSDDATILRYVDLTTTSVARAERLAPPSWMETLASSGRLPMLASGERDGRRVVALAFSPDQSDLPLQVAFPILVNNLVNYLRPLPPVAADEGLRPGDPVQIPRSSALGGDELAVVSPDGSRTRVRPGGTFGGATTPGVYEMVDEARRTTVGGFAVNAGSPDESRITAAVPDQLRTEGSGGHGPTQEGGSERWWLLALAALSVLLAEWYYYTRPRLGVPWRQRRRA